MVLTGSPSMEYTRTCPGFNADASRGSFGARFDVGAAFAPRRRRLGAASSAFSSGASSTFFSSSSATDVRPPALTAAR